MNPNAPHGTRSARIGALASEALRVELDLERKPGLVTPTRRGSHADMDAATFVASIAALDAYFVDCAALGATGADFVSLRTRAIEAEARMRAATDGVNTHKGAIFTLGLLAAAAGWREGRGSEAATAAATGSAADPVACSAAVSSSSDSALHSVTESAVTFATDSVTSAAAESATCLAGDPAAASLGHIVGARWGAALVAHRAELSAGGLSHGQLARLLHAVPGAREHAAAGFPTLFGVTLPALRTATRRGVGPERACLHALLSTTAVLPDTNLVHRGGPDGLFWAQQASEDFVAAGSVFVAGWERRLENLARAFEQRWLSPGGSADLLSAAWFVHRLEDATDAAIPPASGATTARPVTPAAAACVG